MTKLPSNLIQTKPVGEYRIGNQKHFIAFSLTEKPHWFHRLMVRVFFGLRWYDTLTEEPSTGIRVASTSTSKPQPKFKS